MNQIQAQAMIDEEIPDYNIFMMCEQLNRSATTKLNSDFYFRNCRPDELDVWKAFPFDSDCVPTEYENFMNQYIADTYSLNLGLFFQNTLFVCDQNNIPIATCSHWKAYGKISTIQWLKTRKDYEGKGIGRALLSEIMRCFSEADYPIYIHTQPGSYKAIKLYADFGFKLLKGSRLGTRTNDLEKCLSILREFMPQKNFDKLSLSNTPNYVVNALENETTIQF